MMRCPKCGKAISLVAVGLPMFDVRYQCPYPDCRYLGPCLLHGRREREKHAFAGCLRAMTMAERHMRTLPFSTISGPSPEAVQADLERLVKAKAAIKAARTLVAKAMGWRHIEAQTRYPADAGNYAGAMATIAKWYRVRPDGGLEESAECPDYLSDDPALNREMRNALRALEGVMQVRVLLPGTAPSRGERVNDCVVVKLVYPLAAQDRVGMGATEAAALVRALDAAGIVELPPAKGKIKEDDE